MTLIFIRGFFIILCALLGFQIGDFLKIFGKFAPFTGIGLGVLAAFIIIFMEISMKRISVRGLSAAVFGLIFGILFARIIMWGLAYITMSEEFRSLLQVSLTLIFCYLGMIMAMRGRDEFNIIIPYVKLKREDQKEEIIVLDTSVIIDGRIADICHTKFIEGRLIIPRFVLKELQQIADSPDSIKRNRGRRGLDMLNKIRKLTYMEVKIHEEDFPELQDVDAKLIKLSKILSAKIFTNDYNLNKIAELQGVSILNINELANALKPVVLPGELMEVKLIKEGKEYNQAVAYLDDGTMVVVDNARHMIGQEVRVIVTSVLQTAAGRMIFTRLETQRGER
ncbi:MAG: PIN domain-containing protein [Candidatus Omnitrophota bacterium]